jgi:hypothetical protein
VNIFDHRDAFAEFAAVPSHLRHEAGPPCERPLVSISIPTFRRAELLLETLASALEQRTDIAFEVNIVDNDPDPESNAATIARQPAHPAVALRYFVNDINIGMFPNWNRCIEVARGEWVTVLNDDDVLAPDFVAHTVSLLRRRTEIEGIVSQTGFIDRRPGGGAEAARGGLVRRAWRFLVNRRYDRDGLAKVEPRSLFFGNSLSSSLGFLFRKEVALALGGFRPEDWPSADYLFYARFSARGTLYLMREELAQVGIGENESLRIEAMTGFMTQGDALRRSMAGRYVPAGWLRMSPLIVSTAVAETNAFWHGALDPEAVGAALDMTLPPPSRTRLNLLRLYHRAL